MRRYTLANPEARAKVDLRAYQAIIEGAVHEFLPTATVCVYQNYYTVEPIPSQSEAIKIGRKISRSDLGKNCILIPKLFCSEIVGKPKIKKKEVKALGGKKIDGGHY